MRVVIDAQALIHQKTGIGAYAAGLLKNLDRTHAQYISVRPKSQRDLNFPKRLLWESVMLPLKARKLKADVIHTVGFSAPMVKPCKIISSVHDLIGMIFPQHLSGASRFYWSRWLPYSFKKVDYLIASSQNTKADIIKLIRYPQDKISVIPLAVDERFQKGEKSLSLKRVRKYIGVDNFILFVGTIEPRKNIWNLILAFAKLDRDLRKAFPLVIVGKRGSHAWRWGYHRLQDLIRELQLEEEVIFTEYISDDDLVCFYNEATFLVYPSLYEGFGLPVLEAMSCGLPVITSEVSSLPEVTGDAAILVNPFRPDDLSNAMRELINDERLRFKLSQQGLLRSKLFSWKKVASQTQDVYSRVYGGGA